MKNQSLLLLALAVFLIALLSSLFTDTLTQRIVTVFFINLMMVLAFQMFMGNSGVASFAHVGFMGIGAYTSIIFTLPSAMKRVTLPKLYPALEPLSSSFLGALLIGGLVAALFAAIIGFPLMRLSGGAAVISTFALLVIIHVLLNHWTALTNGPRTVFSVPRYTSLWATAVWALLALALGYAFKYSNVGLKLRASREDEKAAGSIGIDIIRMRWFAFTLSAFIAGIAGGLYAHFITSFGAGAFYLSSTFTLLAMLIVGGSSSVSGAFLGTVAITVLSEGVRAIENAINISQVLPSSIAGTTEVIVSITMILVLILRPAGLMGHRELEIFKKGND